ncbi:MAG: helix-turn-helix domain-containing protein [Actinomycetota bacterium]|nr:helix-turn-helix domain-containing protein [Actinomycetota bacterium]
MAGRREDPKEESLRAAGALNPRPGAVADAEFAGSEFLDARDLVQVKYEMVRRVRVGGDSVSAAADAFGFSRPSWYAAAAAIDSDGLPGLLPARKGPRQAHKLSDEVLADLRAALAEDPTLRSADLVERVEQRFSVRVHPRSVERALGRPERPKSR